MADTKTTALTAATSWASGDLLYMVRDPAGTPVSRKITCDNFLQNLVCAANSSLLKSTTGYSLTGSNASSMIDLAGTLNTTGNPAIIKVAISNTASGATTKFLSFLAGASGTTEVFSVDKSGIIRGDRLVDSLTGNYAFQPSTAGASYIDANASLIIRNGASAYVELGRLTSAGLSIGTGQNCILAQDAANTLALRNSTNAQAFNIYNTYTSGSVYERGFMRWASNILEIGTEHVGASGRAVRLQSANSSGDGFLFRNTSQQAWVISFTTSDRSSSITIQSNRIDLNNGGWGSALEYGAGASSQHALLSRNGNGATTYFGLAGSAAGIMQINNGAGKGSGYGSAIEVFEMTAPSAPSANGVRIYAEDNGSGKTRLMALFPSGVAQQIAIEP